MKKSIIIISLLVLMKWWFTDPTVKVGPDDLTFSYIVKYTGGAGSHDNLPMLVALHGNGDTPQNFFNTALDQIKTPARIVLLKGPIPKGTGSAWPWTKEDFSRYGSFINEAIQMIELKYPTKEKPILLGFSGGGGVAYYSSLAHGYNYSYIFPISGRLSKDIIETISLSIEAEVIAYHGQKDSIISIGGGQAAAKELTEKGVNVEFIEFNKVDPSVETVI